MKYSDNEKRQFALDRADELRSRIEQYREKSESIPTGFKLEEQYAARKEEILAFFNASEKDWNDWHWQLRNRITEVNVLKEFLKLSEKEIQDLERVSTQFRWAVSPYYLSLMDPEDTNCPVRMQGVPIIQEMQDSIGEDDPMGEEFTSPAPRITRRYADRLIINVTNQCAMYCRHC